MKIFSIKNYVWHFLFIICGLTISINANESVVYSSLSYDLMKSICKSKVEFAEGGMPVCTSCLEVSAFRSTSTESFAFEKVFYDDFTGNGTKEVFVVTAGCESHADNWGGSILFRKIGNRWQRVFYRAGHLGKCKKLQTANGRHEILCLGEYMNQGYGNDRLVHFRVENRGLINIETLYSGENDEGAFDSKNKNTLVEDWYLKDINGDSYLDVIVFVNQSGEKMKKIIYVYKNGIFYKDEVMD